MSTMQTPLALIMLFITCVVKKEKVLVKERESVAKARECLIREKEICWEG